MSSGKAVTFPPVAVETLRGPSRSRRVELAISGWQEARTADERDRMKTSADSIQGGQAVTALRTGNVLMGLAGALPTGWFGGRFYKRLSERATS